MLAFGCARVAAVIDKMKIAPLKGLFVRLLMASLLIAILCLGVIISFLSAYHDRMATAQAEMRLSRSLEMLAPVIDGAVVRGDVVIARQILENLVEENGVICVDYTSASYDGNIPFVLSLPLGGCASFTDHDISLLDISWRSSGSAMYHFLIDARYFQTDRNNQIAITLLVAMTALLFVFVIIGLLFRRAVLRPLRNLQDAMLASRPAKPALADIFAADEIGAVSRTYNKLAASSRIYFARLEKSQKKLETSESKFKDMAEISGDWFYEMDHDLRFTFISDRFFEIAKIAPDQVLGKSRLELIGTRAQEPKWQAHLADLNQHKPFKNFEYRLSFDDGEPLVFSINGKPIFDDEGKFTGYRGTGADVSDITRDRQLLEETNRNFGESVSYASSIQRGLLPSKEMLDNYFGKTSLIWQPKDLVGGDFYWIGMIGGSRYMVFFDCTGHGVPGAFMTLITVSVLDSIVAASPFALPPAQMLEQIHRGVTSRLGITAQSPGKDGLDCAVIKLEISEGQLEFAGASLDLMVVGADGTVERIRGSRHSLGYQVYPEARTFESHVRPIADHSFVLMTDGLATQVGAETKRVLGTRRIIETLEQVEGAEPAKLARRLGLLLKNWQGSEERRDDVSIFAFKP